jgi:hypothetical protein
VTFLLAILLALGVPFATLHTEQHRVTCCCPDPDHCVCPDHKPDKSGQPRMQTCHRQTVDGIAAELAAFEAPPLAELPIPSPRTAEVAYALPSPHAPPSLRQPDAPS